MLDFVYQVSIHPLEFLLGFAFAYLYSLSDSHGLAIVLLSLLVNTLLIPFYLLSEKWRADERAIQLKMGDKVREIKSVYSGYERHALLRTLYRQHHYNPLYALKSVAGLFVQFPFFIAAYQLLINSQSLNGESFLIISDLAKPDQLIKISEGSFNVLPITMTLVSLAAAYVYGFGKGFKENLQHYIIASVFLVVLYSSSSALLIYWTVSNVFNLIKNIIFLMVRKDSKLSPLDSSKSATPLERSDKKLFFLGWALAFFLPLVSAPLALLSSGSFIDFSEKLSYYIAPLIGVYLYCLILGIVVCWILPFKFVRYIGGLFCIISLGFLIDLFAFSENYGDMSNFVFEQGYSLDLGSAPLNILILSIVALAVTFFMLKKWQNSLINILSVCLVASVFVALFHGYKFYGKRIGIESQGDLYQNKLFSFSSEGQNVVVIMMDRMVGGYIPEALRLIPGLAAELEGFVWYPKTLSPGSYTIQGVPTIAGGYDYLPGKVNNERSNKRLDERVDEAFRVMPYNFSKAGFKSTLIQPSSFFNPTNESHIENTEVKYPFNNHHKYWRKRNNVEINSSEVHSKLVHFGLFRASPLVFRRAIYSDGSWQPFKENNHLRLAIEKLVDQGVWSRSTYYGGIRSEKVSAAVKNWSIMEDLGLLSSVSEDKQDRFYFFSNELTHEPWATRPDLGIELHRHITFPVEDMQRFKDKNSVQHVYTVAAAMKHIANWLDWMKKTGVYDNTRIIVVSDHGRNVLNPMFDKQRLSTQGEFGLEQNQVGWFHSTLLIKDFDARHDFRISNKFMTTADVPWLALNKITDGVNPYTGSKLVEPTTKLPWHVSFTPWRIEDNGTYKYTIKKYFVVENEDIFDTANWSEPLNETDLPPPSVKFE